MAKLSNILKSRLIECAAGDVDERGGVAWVIASRARVAETPKRFGGSLEPGSAARNAPGPERRSAMIRKRD